MLVSPDDQAKFRPVGLTNAQLAAAVDRFYENGENLAIPILLALKSMATSSQPVFERLPASEGSVICRECEE